MPQRNRAFGQNTVNLWYIYETILYVEINLIIDISMKKEVDDFRLQIAWISCIKNILASNTINSTYSSICAISTQCTTGFVIAVHAVDKVSVL